MSRIAASRCVIFLGLPVQFQIGGSERHHPLKPLRLSTVMYWYGAARSCLNYHTVLSGRGRVHRLQVPAV